jgi:ketosteroid isomerase-like protein
MTDTTTGSRAALRSYLDALLAGDLDRIAASFAEDATWSLHGTLPLAGVRRGRAAIVEFLCSAASLYVPGTQSFSFGDITADGERAVLEWRVTGTSSATGRQYDNEYCGVFVIRDGRIAEVREYLDSLQAAETLFPAE